MKLAILISIVGIFLALSLYAKKQVIPDPIPVCTEKRVSGLIHCGECHEKGEY